MLLTKSFDVPEDTTNYIERLAREVEGAKAIIAFMLSQDMQTNTASFKTYNAEYQDAHAAYDIAKNELQSTYIPQEFIDKDGKNINWNLDYATSKITVTYTGRLLVKEFEAYTIDADGKFNY